MLKEALQRENMILVIKINLHKDRKIVRERINEGFLKKVRAGL